MTARQLWRIMRRYLAAVLLDNLQWVYPTTTDADKFIHWQIGQLAKSMMLDGKPPEPET